MRDDGLYERLHDLDVRRRIAAIVTGNILEWQIDENNRIHQLNERIGVQCDQCSDLMVEKVSLILAALAGDFDKVKHFYQGGEPGSAHSLALERIKVVLGE